MNNDSDAGDFSIHLLSESSIHMPGIFIHIFSERPIHIARNPQHSLAILPRSELRGKNQGLHYIALSESAAAVSVTYVARRRKNRQE